MILPHKPKYGAIAAASRKPGFVQEMGQAGPPDFSMADFAKDGQEMAAQRLIEGVKSGSTEAVISALRNLLALMDSEEQD